MATARVEEEAVPRRRGVSRAEFFEQHVLRSAPVILTDVRIHSVRRVGPGAALRPRRAMRQALREWIPASAGMTAVGRPGHSPTNAARPFLWTRVSCATMTPRGSRCVLCAGDPEGLDGLRSGDNARRSGPRGVEGSPARA